MTFYRPFSHPLSKPFAKASQVPLSLVGGLTPPPGFVFLVDSDGAYLVDSDGAYLVEAV